MKNFNRIDLFRYSDQEAPDIERDKDDVLTSAEISRLAFLAEHPEFEDPIVGLLLERNLNQKEPTGRNTRQNIQSLKRIILEVKIK